MPAPAAVLAKDPKLQGARRRRGGRREEQVSRCAQDGEMAQKLAIIASAVAPYAVQDDSQRGRGRGVGRVGSLKGSRQGRAGGRSEGGSEAAADAGSEPGAPEGGAALQSGARLSAGARDSSADAGRADWLPAEGAEQGPRAGGAGAEPGAAGICPEVYEAKHRAEGAAAGNHDVCGGAIFCAHDHAAGDDDGTGGAQPGIGGRDLQDRASLRGEPAGSAAQRRAVYIARQRPADRVFAAGQRIPDRGGGRERGTRADHPQLALFGGGPLVPRGSGGAGIVAGGGAEGRKHCAGVDPERGRRAFLRGVAAGGGDGIHEALFPVVVWGRLQGGGWGGRAGPADGGRGGTGREASAHEGTDCVPAEEEGGVARVDGAGIRGGPGGVLSGVRGERVRHGGDRRSAAGVRRTADDEGQWATGGVVSGAGREAVHRGGGSGGGRVRRGLLVRGSDRPGDRDAVRGIAWALSSGGAGAAGGASGPGVQRGAGGGGAEQSRTCGAGEPAARRIREPIQGGAPGGMADFGGEPAVDDREPGGGAEDSAETVSQPVVPGGVPDVRATCGREHGSGRGGT